MTWLSLIFTLLGLVRSLVDFLERRKMLQAAEARIVREGVEGIVDRLRKALEARNRAEREHDAGVVHRDDPNIRRPDDGSKGSGGGE